MCLSVRDHIFRTIRVRSSPFLVRVTAVARSVNSIILWRCSDTLRISGFMDDVIFAHKPRLLKSPSGCGSEAHTILAAWRVGIPVAGSGRSLYTKVTGQVAAREGAESAVYDCLVYYTVV